MTHKQQQMLDQRAHLSQIYLLLWILCTSVLQQLLQLSTSTGDLALL
jgi:hypothetical protein